MSQATVSGAACTVWFASDNSLASIEVQNPVNKEFVVSANKVKPRDATFLFNEAKVASGQQPYTIRSGAGKTIINIGPVDADEAAVVTLDFITNLQYVGTGNGTWKSE
ncbi:hypothetical protein FS749_007698 [Ceratobasidium sp. UAMH 11750]|nr:hypothetical protein FS749_007698 [Ceratobasidium sp. UAMH 11750]